MVYDCRLWRPVCQGREVMTPCVSPLWTKTGVFQKLPANGLHISLVTNRQTQSPCPSNWSDYLHVADDTDDKNMDQTEQPTNQPTTSTGT